ncbi:MAG: hypothetical protein M3P50_11360, partial [Actinomycetota bacterium]|nr:hypothetical protein [Actinomycetota bacterium]
MPLAICAVLIALLLGLGFALEDGEEGRVTAAGQRVAPLETIARRVERIRRLRFENLPEPRVVSAATARREGLADLDRGYPERRRRIEEEIYKLLGLLSARDDLREISGSILSEQVAGYYDPRSGALRIVDAGAPANRVLDETTLAHELTHALEDQRFDLRTEDLEASGDEAFAYAALVEGTATALMTEYERLHFRPEEALGGAAAAAFGAPSTDDLPPFVLAQLLFPYLGGQELVDELYSTGGDSWRLVDLAHRVRPPASTEQVMHPRKYLEAEQPARVELEGVGRVLGRGWRRVEGATFGEWETRELLRAGDGGGASRAAAGWGGDRYELWRRGPLPAAGCAAPCVGRDALVMRWQWDTRGDAREFERALAGGFGDAVAPGAAWEIARGRDGRTITLAIAGDRAR